MCTSVPHTPARRTRISTSSSRIRGSATSFSLKPGAADSLTSAFTSTSSDWNGFLQFESQTWSLHNAFGSDHTLPAQRFRRFASLQAFDQLTRDFRRHRQANRFHAHLLQADCADEFHRLVEESSLVTRDREDAMWHLPDRSRAGESFYFIVERSHGSSEERRTQ